MVETVGEGGGAARSAAMSAVVMRGLLGASTAFSVSIWLLTLPRLLLQVLLARSPCPAIAPPRAI